jgi:glucans biosynthesis protein
MHGGGAGSGAPAGNRNALRHGAYSGDAVARRRALRKLLSAAATVLADLGKT